MTSDININNIIILTICEAQVKFIGDKSELESGNLWNEIDNLTQETLREFSGELIDRSIDCFVIKFESAHSALHFALTIHEKVSEQNTSLKSYKKIQIQIGIHSYESVVEINSDLDPVILVSKRIAGIISSGGIAVTDNFYQKVRGHIKYPVEDIGRRELKDIETPVQVYTIEHPWVQNIPDQVIPAIKPDRRKSKQSFRPLRKIIGIIVIGFILWYFWNSYDPFRYNAKSIAVLPFSCIDTTSQDKILCDGLTGSLITLLNPVPELKIIVKTSTNHFKNTNMNAKQIAKKLNINSVLEGKLQTKGDSLKLQIQLTDRYSEKPLWYREYHTDFANLIPLMDEIRRNILLILEISINEQEIQSAGEVFTLNTEAYRNFIYGEFYLSSPLPESIKKSIEYFECAIENDKQFALAYASLSNAYFFLGKYGLNVPKTNFLLAKKYASAGLAISDQYAELYTSFAHAVMITDYDWITTEKNFNYAIQLNPGYVPAKRGLALLLKILGQNKKSEQIHISAKRLDPLSSANYLVNGQYLFFDGQYNAALDNLKKVIAQDSLFFAVYPIMVTTLIQLKHFDISLEICSKASQYFQDNLIPKALLCYTYAVSGNHKKAEEILLELEELSRSRYLSPFWAAAIYNALDQRSEAFNALSAAIQTKDPLIIQFHLDPTFANLKVDPRYMQLLHKINLN